MFILTTISDLIQIAPQDFSKFSAVAIEDNINEKYANKVIQKIGLCISFYDLLESSDGLIGHGTGLVNVNVGVEFFNDILIPPELLLPGAKFDYADQVWTWDNDDGTTLYFDVGEVVRFRIETEEWHDQIPNGPDSDQTVAERKAAYSIIGSMQMGGLGPVTWW
ncbi:DNA-directed RNA polymerase III subunit 22.9 kDa [Penicillium verhagenii]|nr:DNA-directed RNA polymerase III subunit 22.9 kDa [Penicillium verhagenii]